MYHENFRVKHRWYAISPATSVVQLRIEAIRLQPQAGAILFHAAISFPFINCQHAGSNLKREQSSSISITDTSQRHAVNQAPTSSGSNPLPLRIEQVIGTLSYMARLQPQAGAILFHVAYLV
jgi:elongation factor P hydroxylase